MKVCLSTHARFHSFDLARQLQRLGDFSGIWTGLPSSRVADEGLPPGSVHSVPLLYLVSYALDRLPRVPEHIKAEVNWHKAESLDRAVGRGMPQDTDALVALSGGGLSSGREIQSRDGIYLCDRGSTHIRHAEDTMREEHSAYGAPFKPFFPRMVAKEEAEYALADGILVPTSYVARTFCDRGFAVDKIKKAPYGVDLSRFYPGEGPPNETFEVLFVGALSIRKGVKYLLEAFERFEHPKKRLTLVGGPTSETADLVAKAVATGYVVATGTLPRDEVRERMSRSHVMVLASVEEGLALVQAQAMACGCPVIASPPTGCEDLYEDGEQGFIVPSRDPGAIADRLTQLADEPDLRARMAMSAVERVKSLGGWDRYGDVVVAHLEELLAAKRS